MYNKRRRVQALPGRGPGKFIIIFRPSGAQVPGGLKVFRGIDIFILLFERQCVKISVPPLAAWCSRWTVFHIMINTPKTTKAVTILAIVWYVLDILVKCVQLLR